MVDRTPFSAAFLITVRCWWNLNYTVTKKWYILAVVSHIHVHAPSFSQCLRTSRIIRTRRARRANLNHRLFVLNIGNIHPFSVKRRTPSMKKPTSSSSSISASGFVLHLSACCCLYCACAVEKVPDSRFQNPESRFKIPESRIQNPEIDSSK